MNTRWKKILSGGVIALAVLMLAAFAIPPVRERVTNKWTEMRASIQYALHPPEKAIFTPGEQVDQAVRNTMAALEASFSATPSHTATSTPRTSEPGATPTMTPTPRPERVVLEGIRYTDQHGAWNYCAPANLAMALSYWGWQGDRMDTGKVLKPYGADKNVMPYEMQNYVEDHTDLKMVIRVGGDLQTVKSFIAAGFPVLIETSEVLHGEFGPSEGWMGHYIVYNGYDDSARLLIGQDSLRGPDHETPYEGFNDAWRAFNYLYMVIYPPEKESTVFELLGDQADETANDEYAALKAANEVEGLSGRDQFFAYYNRGTNLVALQDYGGASSAYDAAFAIYPHISEADRPYRVIWYETGPYYAYFFTQRYWDVINLATTTLDAMAEPILEESYYWRARAELALGDTAGAARDVKAALKYHEGFAPALELRQQINSN